MHAMYLSLPTKDEIKLSHNSREFEHMKKIREWKRSSEEENRKSDFHK